MTFGRIGGLAALTCAATYLFGFALLVTVLAPLGYGTGEIDPAAVVRFTQSNPGLIVTWNTVIYIVNALALTVLVAAISARIGTARAGWSTVTLAFGLIWCALVLGAGMIANVASERAVALAAQDFDTAVRVWTVLHAVELGLGGGNEIAGGVWILCVSLAALLHRVFGRGVVGLGLATGLGGLLTILPPLGDVAGAVFGLGAIAWFVAVGVALLRHAPADPSTGSRADGSPQ